MSCCCDCDDIEHYDVDDLLDAINDRLRHGNPHCSRMRLIAVDDIDGIRRALRRDDPDEAMWLLESALFPKWKHLEACRKALAERRRPAPKVGLWQHSV